MLENGLEKCTCLKTKCKRHGNCMVCIEHHTRSLPRCKRVDKSALSNRNNQANTHDLKRGRGSA